MEMPAHLLRCHPPWEEAHEQRVAAGRRIAAQSSVTFVGLARNCAGPLAANLQRLTQLASGFHEWALHIESNDCKDTTLEVLAGFCRHNPRATFHYEDLGTPQFGAEFAGRRTIAMANFRDACQRWVRACTPKADYVVVIDFDAWGGWLDAGVFTGLSWLAAMPDAYGMASVSLFHHAFDSGPAWAHYDLWALRGVGQARCYWDTYTAGYGGFGYSFTPAIGSPPVLVASAFGGLCVYRAADFLQGTYDGTTDCEHVPFHQSIAAATGKNLYLNPSQRTVMHWVVETDDAGQHRDD